MTQIGEAFVRVRAVADTRSFEQATQKTVKSNQAVSRSLRETERDFGRFGRGAAVGTGALQGLGRAAAFASTAFLGGAGLVYGIRSTVAAAEQAQVSLTQTQQALKNSGLSWDQYGKRIQDASLATAKLSGFDDERLLRTFSNLVRRTGDVNRALYLNALSADVARGRNIELEQAQQLVLKASIGQVGALRRLGLNLKAGASGYEAINFLAQKYAGSAQKYGETAAGAQARFNVALQNTQEVIGAAVLPSITRLLNKGTDWLNNTKNQERIQRTLNTTIRDGTAAFKGLGDAIGGVSSAYTNLGHLTAKLPGGHGGFWDTLLHGTIFAQLNAAANSMKKLNRELGFGAKNSEDFGNALGGVSLNLQSVVGHFQEFITGFEEPTNVLDTQHGGAGFAAAAVIARKQSAAAVTRNQATATSLAQAQAEGTRAQITAAANARLAYIRDTIAFAKRLISQGRGDTKQLEATLQNLYGEQGSDLGILSQFRQDDATAAAKRAADAKAKADKAAAAAAKQAAVVKANADKVLRAVKAANKLRADQLNATLAAGRAYTYSFVTGLGAIGAANRKAAAAKAARVAGRAADASEATLLGLQNTLAEDDLITNPAKRLAKQKKDQQALVTYYQGIVNTLEKQKKGLLAIRQAKANVISAQVALHSLSTSTSAAGGGFTLQQLFAEAGSELQQYGSNVGTDLSPQDARASFAGIVKSSATTVHQHFYGSRPTGQALADARAVARNSK